MVSCSLAFDMRAPDFGGPAVDLYAAALDQCAWADSIGFETVRFMEHHASTDGYLPSPLIMAAAAAGRTQRILIAISVMQLPLYHPLRAAEDLAVLDLISGGRLRLTVGAGYRLEEFEQFGVDLRKRPSLMEKGIAALKQAWTGEPFDYEGKIVRILPRPAQKSGPAIIMGGSSRAAAERAARIADGFAPVAAHLYDDYRTALAALGKPEPEPMERRASYMYLHVCRDPESDKALVGQYLLHENNDYADWLEGQPNPAYRKVDSPDELWSTGRYKFVTPEQCVELARRDGWISFKPLAGGIPPDIAWESLKLFESEVLPHIQ